MSLTELGSLDAALDRFLQANIAIPATSRSSAATSQNYLRGVLRNKAISDPEFPQLLSTSDKDFLGGSFARHTKIWPLDDIDLFLPLDGAGLRYINNGLRLPYQIASDSGTSRLDLPRWKIGNLVNSGRVLEGLATALKVTYPLSDVSVDNHCVNLQTGVAATSESEGIGFDLVPCFLLLPDDGSEEFYLVPDRFGGWMRSNPRKDTAICEVLHKYHYGTYRKTIRLLKFWNKTQLSDKFQSYYIELVVSKKFGELMDKQFIVGYDAQALAIGFTALLDAYVNGDARPIITDAPYIKAPILTGSEITILKADVNSANVAFDQSYKHDNLIEALQKMNSIFSVDFF
jgi:hypothetical protein